MEIKRKFKNIIGFALNELNGKVEHYKVNFGVGYSLYKKINSFIVRGLLSYLFCLAI